MVVAVRGLVGTAEPLVAEQSADEGVMLEQVRYVASSTPEALRLLGITEICVAVAGWQDDGGFMPD